uniref:Uncharacterized protein n=1 Tax=Amanita bisporigera TaxID=87325 RepID=A0A5Q0N269_AMABI|nr:hypothetical protein [Amanita bisporigera]QFZ98553.1 hypothetical protein [Amanita bisporigera]
MKNKLQIINRLGNILISLIHFTPHRGIFIIRIMAIIFFITNFSINIEVYIQSIGNVIGIYSNLFNLSFIFTYLTNDITGSPFLDLTDDLILLNINFISNNSEVKDKIINNEIIDKVKDNNQDNSEIVKEIIDKSIKCPLESGEINQLDISPLEALLSNILTFNIWILFVIIIIIILLFNLIIFNKNSNFIILLVNKILSDKFKFKKDIVDFLEKIVNKYTIFSKKYLVILIIINSFLLFFMLLFNIWITADLTNNLDDYVLVYNYLKQK